MWTLYIYACRSDNIDWKRFSSGKTTTAILIVIWHQLIKNYKWTKNNCHKCIVTIVINHTFNTFWTECNGEWVRCDVKLVNNNLMGFFFHNFFLLSKRRKKIDEKREETRQPNQNHFRFSLLSMKKKTWKRN